MTGNKKIVHFLSASDRINYGDLLFPIIFEFYSKNNNIKFYNYGIVKSDLSHFGAAPTKSYRMFQKNVRKYGGNIIVGGGEVLFVDWGTLYAFINFNYSKLLYWYRYSKFEKRYNLTRFLLSNGKVFIPFAPNKSELSTKKEIKIFYNAVGGTFLNSRLKQTYKFKESLLSADYISVRDNRVKKSLSEHNIDSIVSPDSAIFISKIFSKEILKDKISFSPIKFKDDYIFLQIGKPYIPKDIVLFSKDLMKICAELNCKVILCPIGLAPRHEDDVFLRKLAKESYLFEFVMPNSLFDIMFLIANSKMFLGTSLHGLITAQSFEVPFIPLDNRVNKVEEYCKTWTYKNIDSCLPYTDLSKVVKIYKNWDFQSAHAEVVKQINLVTLNFQQIFKNLV
ncbi:polysaccharide pyruvyl transferase family protein [Salegentibacter salegens]|uniref:Polysaccharide pyruvyl transferase n=1 Tax=Salegentibacter salegens TaxID=143223 RepID=A0A1M7NDW2_9FLAO|nr:polysaccharide pyruvyl transferase family protein [Salegentibacter salegens]PRX41541.1 polysaccharide pyruvyl transferase [Salegentibacter salegens]SHN01849.1 Polysaccharide pyruvyl transferase [Salegentibacter salegens]